MANFINGDSGATSGSAGVKIGSDGSNSLAIQTNNVTAITIDGNQNASGETYIYAAFAESPFALNNRAR